jgi:oligopeptidase A
MTLDMLVEQTRDSLLDLDAALAAMLARLDEMSRLPVLDERDFVEIGAIVNNITYMLLYLESNAAHVSVDFIDRYRNALTEDPERDRRLLALLAGLSCESRECEAARVAFVVHLSKSRERRDGETDLALADLLGEGRAILDRVRQDKAAFLERLGVAVGDRRPDMVFYGLLSGAASDATRQKLSFAWDQVAGRHQLALRPVVDGMVEQRRRRCDARHGTSVLADTLSRCNVGESESRDYWEVVLALSVAEHTRLEAEVEGTLGVKGGVKANFGRFIEALQAGRSIPPIPLAACIDTMVAVVESLFGLAARPVTDVPPHMTTLDIARDGEVIGRINFDLWDAEPIRRRANTTTGIRNRTDWRGIVQMPVAHVSCRFRRSKGDESVITFQNAHSLFHEFGHAMNHLLVTRRVPNISGLEFLPLERLEILSMWFERFVYHPVFEDFLGFEGADLDGLELSRRIKMLEYRRTHLERALICALDFEVHADGAGDIRSCYERIDSRFGVSHFCALPDVLQYFIWPMLLANPGAYFSYLWGAGASAERFAPYMRRRLAEMPGPEETFALFRDCFSFDAPSIRPDPHAVFEFYNTPCVASAPEA